MRACIGLLMLVAVLIGCDTGKETKATKSVKVSGMVGFPPSEGTITIKSWNDTTNNVQTLEFNRETYTYKGDVKIGEPGFYRISFFEKQIVDVILDRADIIVNVDGNVENGFSEIIGSPDYQLVRKIDTIRMAFNRSQSIADLNTRFNEAVSKNDEKTIEEVQVDYQQMLQKPSDSIAQLLIASSPSVAVLDMLYKREIDPDRYFYAYEAVAAKLTGEWANYSISKNFLQMVSKMKPVAIGQVAPEIELPNPEGKLIKLSSLRGKYVLVDFWAKWCGPCRKENPNVVAAYKRFNSKGFEVFGVSLDQKKEDWVRAIEQDNLTWTHVSDLKYFDSDAARLYNINAIPFSILLDKDGVIVAKNLRGVALHKKLEELLKDI